MKMKKKTESMQAAAMAENAEISRKTANEPGHMTFDDLMSLAAEKICEMEENPPQRFVHRERYARFKSYAQALRDPSLELYIDGDVNVKLDAAFDTCTVSFIVGEPLIAMRNPALFADIIKDAFAVEIMPMTDERMSVDISYSHPFMSPEEELEDFRRFMKIYDALCPEDEEEITEEDRQEFRKLIESLEKES